MAQSCITVWEQLGGISRGCHWSGNTTHDAFWCEFSNTSGQDRGTDVAVEINTCVRYTDTFLFYFTILSYTNCLQWFIWVVYPLIFFFRKEFDRFIIHSWGRTVGLSVCWAIEEPVVLIRAYCFIHWRLTTPYVKPDPTKTSTLTNVYVCFFYYVFIFPSVFLPLSLSLFFFVFFSKCACIYEDVWHSFVGTFFFPLRNTYSSLRQTRGGKCTAKLKKATEM